MPSESWPVVHDGREFQPIPRTWVEYGIDEVGDGPQCRAVSVARSGGHVYVRYLHPEYDVVDVGSWPLYRDAELGWVPRPYVVGAWPRSIAAGRLTPAAGAAPVERELVAAVWDGIETGVAVVDGGFAQGTFDDFEREYPAEVIARVQADAAAAVRREGVSLDV
jgi:hypothetical protein